MAIPAVQGDRITGICPSGQHQVPNPGAPPPSMPNPQPLNFSAPLKDRLISTVTIGGKPVAVKGSTAAPFKHPEVIPPDKTLANPLLQVAKVDTGSATVTFGGEPAATSDSRCSTCGGSARIMTTVANVMVG